MTQEEKDIKYFEICDKIETLEVLIEAKERDFQTVKKELERMEKHLIILTNELQTL